jgi:hypothetical protein
MQMLLHINTDFDDDILMDVVGLLEEDEEEQNE